MREIESTDRPTASGHRFGPDLACAECGISWDEHQRDPSPCCHKEAVSDASVPAAGGAAAGAFERRPSGDAKERNGSAASSHDSQDDSRATHGGGSAAASATGAGKGKS